VRPPSHSGKSNYPTVARLFGRWNEGQLVANDPTDAEPAAPEPDDDVDSLMIPRQRLMPRWVLLVIAGAVVFALVAFVFAGRGRPPAAAPAPSVGNIPAPAPTLARALARPAAEPPEAAVRHPAATTTHPRPAAASLPRSDTSRRRRPPAGTTNLTDEALPPSF
jgi:hypothetical protein